MIEYKTRLNPKGVIKMEAVYSRFSMRMRIAAISLLMVFFSQQVSWACAGNLSLLVNLPPSPLIYQDHGEFNRLVANRVYSLVKPSFRDKAQELKSAYQWLKTPSTQTVPCSAYVLYNLLQAKGIKPKIEDISASLISLDLTVGNLKPPFTDSRIDNSLYAMAKTAESQGVLLYPFRLNSITPELLNSIDSQTPFIAHLNYSEALDKGHFVLVTGIDADKVHFFYDKGDTFLPLEKFLEEFSGYCLLSSASVGTAQCAVPTISDAEAQGVLGAKSYKGVKVDYTKLFKEPSTKDLLIGFGVSVGSIFGASMLGGVIKGEGLNFGKAMAGFGVGVAQGEISKASVNFGVQQFKMKPEYAQIMGYVVSGAMTGAMSGINNSGQFKIGSSPNFWNNHAMMRGAIMGTVQGGMQGGASVLAYQGIKNTSFYQKNPFIARQVASLVGSAAGYAGFYAITGAMKMSVNIDKSVKKGQTGNAAKWDGTPVNRVSVKDPGVWNNLKFAFRDTSFLSSMISQGTALGVEWAAGPKYAKYSRILGQGIGGVAGGWATGDNLKPWQSVMNGALSGGISLGFGYLGGEVGKDGKNKLGLTDIQMAGIEWLATATLFSGIAAAYSKTSGKTFADGYEKLFSGFSTNYVTFGRTSPLYTQGAGGWSSFMYNQKIADFGGFANYKANADYSMKLQGYKSWSKFVDDGKAANLLPSFSNSLVRYASTSLHYGAVDNSVAVIGLVLPKKAADFLGIEKHRVANENIDTIENKIEKETEKRLLSISSEEKKVIDDRIKELEERLQEIKSLNNSEEKRNYSWIVTSQPNSRSESGWSRWTLGGSKIGFDEEGKLNFLTAHLRNPMQAAVKVGNKTYKIGEEYKNEDVVSLNKGGSGAIPILVSKEEPADAVFLSYTNALFSHQDDGYLSVGLKQVSEDGTYKVGRMSSKHEKGKPTITDIFTSHQVTPKKFWFDKKTPINTGITLAVYNRAIDTNQGLKYLGKNKEGLYPAAGFGYSESVSVTKDGDKVLRSKGDMIVELSVLGQGVEIKTIENTESSAPATEKQEQPQQQTQTANTTAEKEQSKSLELTKPEDAVNSSIRDSLRKEYETAEAKLELAKGAVKSLQKEGGVKAGAKDENLNKAEDSLVTALMDFSKARTKLEGYGELIQSAEVELAAKDKAAISKPAEQVKAGEKTITTTITPKITTAITINQDDLFKLSSRDNPQSFPVKVGESNFGVEKSQKVVAIPADPLVANKSSLQVGTPAQANVKKMNIVAYTTDGKPLTEDGLINIFANKGYRYEGINNGYVDQNKYVNKDGDVVALSARGEDMVLDIKGGKLEDTDFEIKSYNNGNGKWKLSNKNGLTEIVDAIIEDGILRKPGEYNAKLEGLSREPNKPYQPGNFPGTSKQETSGPQELPEENGQRIKYLKEIEESNLGANIPPPTSVILWEGAENIEVDSKGLELDDNGLRQKLSIGNSGAEKSLPSTRGISTKPEEFPKSIQGNTNLREQIEQLVMFYDDQGSNLRLEQNSGIKMPQGYNISAEINEKSRGDVINELYLYNATSFPPKTEAAGERKKVISEEVKAFKPVGDANVPGNVHKAVAPDGNNLAKNKDYLEELHIGQKVEEVDVENNKGNAITLKPDNEGSKDITIIVRDLERKNAEITKKVEDMGVLPLLNTGKRKEIDKLNQGKEKETRDAYRVIGQKRGMAEEAIALDAKIREKQDQVLALQLDIQDRKDIKENSGWIWKGIDWVGENIGVITPLADKERELKNREKVVTNLQKELLALKNGDKSKVDKLNQDSIIRTEKRGDKLFTGYANGKVTVYNEKEGELITLYPNGKLIVGNRNGDFTVELPDSTFISNKGIKLPNGKARDSEGILISPSMDWKDSFEKGANAVKATGTFVWSLMKWPVTREYPNFGKYGKSSE